MNDNNGALIAKIKHGAIQFGWGGGLPVLDARNDPIFALAPGENVDGSIVGKIDAWSTDKLVLIKDEEVLGFTGGCQSETHGSGLAQLVTELPGAIVKSFQEEILGKTVDRAEYVSAQLKLNAAGSALDPRLVLAILLFKSHYHDLRNS